MSTRSVQVEVKKREFTPRDRVMPDRFNLTLAFEAAVPENCYIFSGAIPEELPDVRVFYEGINSLRGKILSGERLDLFKEIESLLNKMNVVRRKAERTRYFPKVKNNYFIPGSSIKGAVRSRIEYKFKPIKIANAFISYSCYIAENPFLNKFFSKNHLKFWGDDVSYFRPSCGMPNVCVVCDLFGSHNLASRINFSDALLTSSATNSVEFLGDLGIEAVKQNSKFSLRVDATNLSFAELGLLLLGFEIFSKSPILIGSFKYRYNPKINGKRLYRNKFSFGLLKFNLINFSEFLSNKLAEYTSVNDLVTKAKEELERSEYSSFIDYNKGVIE